MTECRGTKTGRKTKTGCKTRGLYLFLLIVFLPGIWIRFDNLGALSLWLDEAWVANSLEESTIYDMIWYTRWTQTTPVAFLLTSRMAMASGAMVGLDMAVCETRSELLLRAIPAIFGVLAMVFVYLYCRTVSTDHFMPVYGALLIGLSPGAVLVSRQLKQYSTDLLFTVLIMWSARQWSRTGKGVYAFIALLTAGTATFFSHLAPAAITAAFFVMFADSTCDLRRILPSFSGISWRRIRYPLAYSAVAVTATGLHYWFLLRHQHMALPRFSYYQFIPPHPFALGWYMRSFYQIFVWNWENLAPLVFMAFVAGVIYAMSRYKRWVWMPPLIMTGFLVVAAGANMLLFGGVRVIHGLAALLVIPAAESLALVTRCISDALKVRRAFVAAAVSVLLISLMIGPAIEIEQPRQDLRSLAALLREAGEADDTVWIYSHALPGFSYYAGSETRMNRIHEYCVNPGPLKCAEYIVLESEKNSRRFWTVFAHDNWEMDENRLEIFLKEKAEIKGRFRFDGASLTLWQRNVVQEVGNQSKMSDF